ncbi:MAG: UDP-2,3-diacylglucosamine diphosphatase [Bdellovibrio sp. CG10_big_fil_rev_8_21_14_0_10_47_8]|nr:MAG: UDP-2,3-diacylglucosamine diphosphatase [Bdellovibrio sp. CG10_big_fil_rev_8_21_14_0_10_47_8]
MQAWFVSDIHLRDINERNSVRLLRFLHFLLKDSEATHLFLLGDIFDLWVGDSDLFQRKFQAIVDALAELKKKGVEVIYFEGNHDVHVKRFWEEKFSIPVFVEHKVYHLGPFQVRLEHGDYINPKDIKYLKYLELIRSKKMEKVAHVVPGKFWDQVGSWSARKSRKRSSGQRQNNEQNLREMIRLYAQDKSQEQSFDYIITGHMHIRDEFAFEAAGKKVMSINLGSWFDEPKALCLTESGHSWREL